MYRQLANKTIKFGFIFLISMLVFAFILPNALTSENKGQGMSFEAFAQDVMAFTEDTLAVAERSKPLYLRSLPNGASSRETDITFSFEEFIAATNVEALPYADKTVLSREGFVVEIKNGSDIDVVTIEKLGYVVSVRDNGEISLETPLATKRLIIQSGKPLEYIGAIGVVTGYENYSLLQYATEKDAYDALDYYNSLSGVYAVPDMIFYQSDLDDEISLTATPGDYTYLTNGAGLIDAEAYNDYLQSVDAAGGLNTVVVAVLDSGVYAEHAMLKGRVLAGAGFVNGETTTNTNDTDGHGTHIAGTICDITYSNVKILPVRVFQKGTSVGSWIMLGINYIRERKAGGLNIVAVNMSFGSESAPVGSADYASYLNFYQQPINQLYNAGIIPVVAAGNESTSDPSFPAACDNVIAVTAYDSYNKSSSYTPSDLAYFSSYGPHVDISAPGVNINSAGINGGYKLMSGTSMATPHVAAAVALLASDSSHIRTAAQIQNTLLTIADDYGNPGFDNYFGNGGLNLLKAIPDGYVPSEPIVPQPPTEPENPTDPGETVPPDDKPPNTFPQLPPGLDEHMCIIQTEASAGGTITPSKVLFKGLSWTVFINPKEGYVIASILVDNEKVENSSKYTFLNIQENHSVIVSFANENDTPNPENPNPENPNPENPNPENPNPENPIPENPNPENPNPENPNPENPNPENPNPENPNPENPNPENPNPENPNPENPNPENPNPENPNPENPNPENPNPENPNPENPNPENPNPENPNPENPNPENPNPENPNPENPNPENPNPENPNPENPNPENPNPENPNPDDSNQGNSDADNPNLGNRNPNSPNSENSGNTNQVNPNTNDPDTKNPDYRIWIYIAAAVVACIAPLGVITLILRKRRR
jgi:subtilisin family serine protease